MSEKLELRIGEKRYDITPPFTNRELHLIKQIAGVRAGEIFDALEGGDSDVLVALAHIGVRRNGTARPSLDELWDLDAGVIEFAEVEAESVDPTPADSTPLPDPTGNPETIPAEPGPPASAPQQGSVPVISGT